jgi:hypothetical protein
MLFMSVRFGMGLSLKSAGQSASRLVQSVKLEGAADLGTTLKLCCIRAGD